MKRALRFNTLFRDLAVLTALSCLGSVAATAALTALLVGLDAAASITVGSFWTDALAIAFVAPLVICPLVALPGRRMILELRQAREELENAVGQDSLTGLLNRRGFEAAAAAELEACRIEGLPAVALMCDIDFFKSINDRFGHDFGDSALEQIAAAIETAVDLPDTVIGRMGGEEFAIFIPDCELAEGEKLAGAIRSASEALSIGFEATKNQITLSVGVAAVEGDESLRLVLSRADAALYQAKRDGRNRVCAAAHRKFISMAA